MPSPRPSLRSFLASARTALVAPPSERSTPLTFVVGNESADLDSLCSAVLFAYVRTAAAPHTLHIPLSNLPREDLALRTEMAAVLRHAGLTPADLLTLSELPPPDRLAPADTRWLLVDHNCLTGELKRFAGQVIGCVDHHADEHAVPPDAQPRVVEQCGSCASLVVEECRAAWEALSPGSSSTTSSSDDAHRTNGTTAAVNGCNGTVGADVRAEDNSLAMIGLAAILSDTINLTAKEKVRPKDPRAVFFLESRLADPNYDRQRYYDEIAAVKEDLSGLSFRDIFRKDYKEWDSSSKSGPSSDSAASLRLGISAVVQDFDYLLDKAQGEAPLLDALADWARERGLDVACVMTASNAGGRFRRHLLVWGLNDGGRAAVSRFVDRIAAPLELQPWGDGRLDSGRERLAFQQHNLAASRKQVAPLLRQALEDDK